MVKLIKNALIAAPKYLQKNLPLESTFLKDKNSLSPIVRYEDWTILAIARLAERFSYVIKERDASVIKDQWFFIIKKRYHLNGIRILSTKILNF